MISMTYGQLKHPHFRSGFAKLANHPSHKEAKVAYNVAKIAKRIEEESKLHDELAAPHQSEFDAKIKELGEKGEDGKLIAHPGRNGQPGYKIAPEHEEAFEEFKKGIDAKVADLDKIEFQIDRPRLKFPDDLSGINLSPLEINGLAPLLEDNFGS